MAASRNQSQTSHPMLAERVKVVLILLPVGLVVIYLGGWLYAGTIALILGLAASEYVKLFQKSGLMPATLLVATGTTVLGASRAWDGFASAPWLLTILILTMMTYHLLAYERGRDQAGTDFAVSLSGIVYFGWVGAYLISVRVLPGGMWWLLLTLITVWLADTGAYFFGSRWGKHKLSPRLSPKKTWEGYFGGILVAVPGGLGLAALFSGWGGPEAGIQAWHGLILGLILAAVTPLGDLGESMVKRQVGAKDSGKLLPGHGGAWDRIDSWLWAGVIGYYLITIWFNP
jgi:phosphatidate cytidylyltransferase